MSAVETQEILNRVLDILNNFVKVDLKGFDVLEEKKLFIESLPVLFEDRFDDGMAIRFEIYFDSPVYVLMSVSKNAVYEIAEKMGVTLDADLERVRLDENSLSFIVEIANMMTAIVADRYARRYKKKVIYSPPHIIKHIFSPRLIDGMDIRGRMANIITYEFNLSSPDSEIKLFIIY